MSYIYITVMKARRGTYCWETASSAKHVQKTREKLSDSVARGNVLGLLRTVRTGSKCIINKIWRAIPLR